MFKSLAEKISKKDIMVLFIILQLIEVVIIVSVWRADAERLVNQISLGSSMASILLAMVAIGYAFVQSVESSKKNILVQTALSKIVEKISFFNSEFLLLRKELGL